MDKPATTSSKNAKKEGASPMLDRILSGGSSISFNLVSHRHITRNTLFSDPRLNRTIIFKYPNFDDKTVAQESIYDPVSMSYIWVPKERPDKGEGEADADDSNRPIETGVFVPYDTGEPGLGGHGIYLRKHNYKELFLAELGIDLNQDTPAVRRDLRVLHAIDQIPSLDPFLLKPALLQLDPRINPDYFSIKPDEELAIRKVISGKLMPILNRALDDHDEFSRQEKSKRFLEAIWNPRLPEAQQFIQAFGIKNRDTSKIFEALKGVSFYEWNIIANSGRVADAVRWLQSKEGVPYDMHQHRHAADTLNAQRNQAIRRIREVSREVGAIFKDYNEAHQRFTEGDDPKPFRNFLLKVNSHYWTLGYGSMALANVSHVYGRAIVSAQRGRLSFDQLTTMLQHINLALQSSLSTAAAI